MTRIFVIFVFLILMLKLNYLRNIEILFVKNSNALGILLNNKALIEKPETFRSKRIGKFILFNRYGWFELYYDIFDGKKYYCKSKVHVGQWRLNYFNQLELEINGKKKKYFFKPWIETGLFEASSKKNNIKLYTCKHWSDNDLSPCQELSDKELEEICNLLVDE